MTYAFDEIYTLVLKTFGKFVAMLDKIKLNDMTSLLGVFIGVFIVGLAVFLINLFIKFDSSKAVGYARSDSKIKTYKTYTTSDLQRISRKNS